MNQNYEMDSERSVLKGSGWVKFRELLKTKHVGMDVDKILEKVSVKTSPIISFGLIEFYMEKDNIYYHIFKRRNTIEYDILIRGYGQQNQLYDLLCLLSEDERTRILNNDWDSLWDDFWVNHNDGSYLTLKSQSQRRFNTIKTILKEINGHVKYKIRERPYIFPKGKPDKNETGLETALREAKEETKVDFDLNNSSTGVLYCKTPIIQYFTGSDDKKYIDYYYVWRRNHLYACPVKHLKSDDQEYHNSPKIVSSDFNSIRKISLEDGKPLTSPKTKERLRTSTISHELESDAWIKIPIFESMRTRIEWENSIDPYDEFGIFSRHFKAILQIHDNLCSYN